MRIKSMYLFFFPKEILFLSPSSIEVILWWYVLYPSSFPHEHTFIYVHICVISNAVPPCCHSSIQWLLIWPYQFWSFCRCQDVICTWRICTTLYVISHTLSCNVSAFIPFHIILHHYISPVYLWGLIIDFCEMIQPDILHYKLTGSCPNDQDVDANFN